MAEGRSVMVRTVLAAGTAIAIGFLSTGCGGGGGSAGPEEIDLTTLKSPVGRLIYQGGRENPYARMSPEEKRIRAAVEVEYLTKEEWKRASDNLLLIGREAVAPLIAVLDSEEETFAASKPYPGLQIGKPGRRLVLGDVAFSTLLEIFQHASDYKGDLPAKDKGAWEKWWEANRKRIRFVGQTGGRK